MDRCRRKCGSQDENPVANRHTLFLKQLVPNSHRNMSIGSLIEKTNHVVRSRLTLCISFHMNFALVYWTLDLLKAASVARSFAVHKVLDICCALSIDSRLTALQITYGIVKVSDQVVRMAQGRSGEPILTWERAS